MSQWKSKIWYQLNVEYEINIAAEILSGKIVCRAFVLNYFQFDLNRQSALEV